MNKIQVNKTKVKGGRDVKNDNAKTSSLGDVPVWIQKLIIFFTLCNGYSSLAIFLLLLSRSWLLTLTPLRNHVVITFVLTYMLYHSYGFKRFLVFSFLFVANHARQFVSDLATNYYGNNLQHLSVLLSITITSSSNSGRSNRNSSSSKSCSTFLSYYHSHHHYYYQFQQ